MARFRIASCNDDDGAMGPWCQPALKVVFPSPPMAAPTVLRVSHDSCVLRVQPHRWLFAASVALQAVPEPEPEPAEPRQEPPSAATCAFRAADDLCWYPHYDIDEDQTYYFQPASKRWVTCIPLSIFLSVIVSLSLSLSLFL